MITIKSKRILIVEDDPAFVKYLRECLRGAELFIVRTLKDAMVHLESNKFDMVICDLMLPDWDRSPEAMLTMISMRARGAVVAAITGRVTNLPKHGCDAAAHKINVGTVDLMLSFLRDAERCAHSESCFIRPVRALENFVAMGQPVHS